MEVRFVTNAFFKRLVDSMSQLASEVIFDFSPTALTIQAIDLANVALLVVFLNGDDENCFVEYDVNKTISIGINLKSLITVLKVGQEDDQVVLAMKTPEDDTLKITLVPPEAPDNAAEFNFRLQYINSDKLGIPDTDPQAVVKMPTGALRKLSNSLESIGDTVYVVVYSDKVVFTTSSQTIGDMKKTLVNGDEISISLQDGEKSTKRTPLAIRYLVLLSNASSISSRVEMTIAKDAPVSFHFPIGKPTASKKYLSYIRFYLAPKIEDSDL